MKYEVRITGQVVESENGGLGGVYGQNTPGYAADLIDEINEAVRADYVDLAQYLDFSRDRDALLSTITAIHAPVAMEPNGDKFIFRWVIESTHRLEGDQEEALIDYLIGQSCDGWGEGFEQRAVKMERSTERVECQECRTGGCDYCDGEGFITEDVEVYFYAKPYYMAQSEKECEKYQVFVLPILEDEEEVKTPVEFVEEAISVCGIDCSSCIHSGCWAHKQSRKTGVPVEKCRDYQKASLSWDIFDRMPKVPEFKLS